MPANQKLFIAVTSPYTATSVWRMGDGTFQRRQHDIGHATRKYACDAHEAASIIVETMDFSSGRGLRPDRVHPELKDQPFSVVFAKLSDYSLPRARID